MVALLVLTSAGWIESDFQFTHALNMLKDNKAKNQKNFKLPDDSPYDFDSDGCGDLVLKENLIKPAIGVADISRSDERFENVPSPMITVEEMKEILLKGNNVQPKTKGKKHVPRETED